MRTSLLSGAALLAAPLLLAAGQPGAVQLNLCYNYDCATIGHASLSARELEEIRRLFDGAGDPAAEREAISRAVGAFYRAAGRQLPIWRDRGGNKQDGEVDGRMDCIDHSANTTLYLLTMEERGWLRFHRVLDPVMRAPWLVNQHWAAHIVESAGGAEYAVDSWFFDNGMPAAVMPLAAWLDGKDPE